jgi:hypothetical protein
MHNVLDACISITKGSGRGLALEFESFLGPLKWHRADRRVPLGAQKHYAQGCINHRCIGGFMHKKPTKEVSRPILWGVEEQVNKGT